MKLIYIITILFFLVACEGKDRKSTTTKSVAAVEEEISIKEDTPTATTEIAPESIPEITPPVIVIADPEPEREPEIQIEPEPAPEPPIQPEPDTQPELAPELETQTDVVQDVVEAVTVYDFENLKIKGIHIVGRSILHEIRNPSAIYCSNTEFFNHEKIEELNVLLQALKGDEILVMDNTKMPVLDLKELIKTSIILLEASPHSRFCPRIYLAINNL